MRDREHVCMYTHAAYIHTYMQARMALLSYAATALSGTLQCGSLSQKRTSLLEGFFFCKRDLHIFGAADGA